MVNLSMSYLGTISISLMYHNVTMVLLGARYDSLFYLVLLLYMLSLTCINIIGTM